MSSSVAERLTKVSVWYPWPPEEGHHGDHQAMGAQWRRRQAIELGELVHLDTASEELTDEFLLFALQSGLLSKWAEAFPDPRQEPEIGMEVILPEHMAARFAGLYSLRKAGYVLRSARVLGALGYSVEVIEPAHSLSLRGTADDQLFSGDVVRKLLVKMETQADLSQPARLPLPRPVSASRCARRASRRAVKQAVDTAEAEARAHKSPNNWWTGTTSMSGSPWCSMPVSARGGGYTFSIRPTSKYPWKPGRMSAAGWSKR